MKIVCAASVLFGREAFETLGETVILPDHVITAEDVRDADVLIIRSKTKVDAQLLEGSRVSFVGSATSGTDHLDAGYLNESLLAWCTAPGCNADSVAEYVATALCCLAHRHGLALAHSTIAVVGVGQIGHRVVRKAEALGMTVLRNDPPLEMATGDVTLMDLEDVLKEADIVTLHVPLTRSGQFPTARLANCGFFSRVKPGCLFINTSRGEVMDSEGLLFAMSQGAVGHAVLDVWENEPFIPADLLAKVDLGTPHIAGYSFEGRLNGTVTVYREACHYFEVEPRWRPEAGMFPKAPEIVADASGKSREKILWDILRSAYDIEADDRALRSGPSGNEPAWGLHFDALRRDYPPRREFPAVKVRLTGAAPDLVRQINTLGLRAEAM